MTATHTQAGAGTPSGERADLLELLDSRRHFLKFTARELTDEQARATSTVSSLCIGGLIKHVTAVEKQWADFTLQGPAAFPVWSAEDNSLVEQHLAQFRLGEGETLAGLLAAYDEVAARTNALIATLDLDESHALPAAPWFRPGARRSNRHVLMHIATETAQHAGHADIIREAIDGARSMA